MAVCSQPSSTKHLIESPNPNRFSIETTPHVGMRGFMALHVVIFHMAQYSDNWKFTWLAGMVNASIQMPFFFLLSGFVLALGSGRTRWAPFGISSCARVWDCSLLCTTEDLDQEELERLPRFNAGRFYWKRFSRMMPSYWLCNLLVIPLVFLGMEPYWGHARADDDVTPADNKYFEYSMLALGTFTWFVPMHGIPGLRWTKLMWPLNGPSWFVSTIVFCYAAFPCLLPALQTLRKSEQRQVAVWGCYAAQLALLAAMFAPLSWRYGAEDAFFAATCWPVTRVPVFVMGVLAGLQRCTAARSVGFGGMGALLGLKPQADQQEDSNNWWAQVVDTEMLIALTGTFSLYLVSRYIPDSEYYLTFVIAAISPIVQLVAVYGLTFDLKCKSYTARFLCSWPIQWWGQISYAVLLIQMPVIGYTTVVTNWRHNADCVEWIDYTNTTNITDVSDAMNNVLCIETERKWGVNGRGFPVWAAPIILVLVAAFAWLLTEFFEKPVNMWLLRYSPAEADSAKTEEVLDVVNQVPANFRASEEVVSFVHIEESGRVKLATPLSPIQHEHTNHPVERHI